MDKLYETTRAGIRSTEVARAIAALVDAGPGLPLVIGFEDVAAQVVANDLADEGVPHVPRRMREAAELSVLADLTKGMFKAGCEQYARTYHNPFSLVTSWFMQHVYTSDREELLRALREQGEEEVRRSLPSKKWRGRGPDGEPTGEVFGGQHVGAVVFPREEAGLYPLFLRNEQSHYGKLAGTLDRARQRTERLPDAKQVDRLRDAAEEARLIAGRLEPQRRIAQ